MSKAVYEPAWGLVLFVSLAGCAADTASESGRESPVEVSAIVAPVVGGESAAACEWPSTVSVNAWGSCTGTLIHPRVVTTAAHCIKDGRSAIHFGENRSTPGAFSVEARCEAGIEGSRGANTSRDWAYCILPDDERIKQIPVTPPLVGCEATQFLEPGAAAWVVGFGTTSPEGAGAGTKRQVAVVVNALNKIAPGTIDVGDAEEGACHGDSGGPLYVHLKDAEHDWGYRVVGSTSGAGARACDCTCSTVYVNIANHVKAIEERELIDVTPCTDAEGNFDPSPECKQLVTVPQQSTGTFPSCGVARTVEPIDSCGVLAATAAASGGSRALPRAGAAGGAVANVSQAVNTAAMPAAAFQPTAGASAAGKAALGSATFSSTAAGGVAPAQPSASASSSACSIAAVGGRRSLSTAWLVSLALGFSAVLSQRRRTR